MPPPEVDDMRTGRERKRRLRGGRVIAVLALLGVAYLISLVVRITLEGMHDERRPADVILVLGAAQADGRPLPVFKARLDHALSLYRDGYAPYLFFTGGKQPGDRFTEAETGRRYARARGVPDSAILTEQQGRTTWQSLQRAAYQLRRARLRRVILVSDPFHAFRLHRMARDLDMQAVVSPVPHSRIRRFSTRAFFTFRETAAYTLYRLFGI